MGTELSRPLHSEVTSVIVFQLHHVALLAYQKRCPRQDCGKIVAVLFKQCSE